MRSFAASLCLVAVAGLPACATRDHSASFKLGEEIPLGILSLRVSDSEVVPSSRAPLQSLSALSGERAIAVFARWEGLVDFGELDKRQFVESFLEHRVTLVDSDRFSYDVIKAMPRDLYYGSAYAFEASPDWVVIFYVWVDSSGYSVRIRHPDPGNEGFNVAVVSLG